MKTIWRSLNEDKLIVTEKRCYFVAFQTEDFDDPGDRQMDFFEIIDVIEIIKKKGIEIKDLESTIRSIDNLDELKVHRLVEPWSDLAKFVASVPRARIVSAINSYEEENN